MEWPATLLLAAPGSALAASAGYLGIEATPGSVLLAASAVYVLVGLLVLQPRLRKAPPRAMDNAGTFLVRGARLATLEDILAELGRAIERSTGAERVAFWMTDNGEARCANRAAETEGAAARTAATEATGWLAQRTAPVTRSALAETLDDPGARSALKLMDQCGADILLAFAHRRNLIGLAIVTGASLDSDKMSFFYGIRAYATSLLSRVTQNAGSRGRLQVLETLDLASAMQLALVPEEKSFSSAGFEIQGVFRPLAACAGDLWTWRDLGEGRVLLFVGDTTGHGAASALLAAIAKGAIDSLCQSHPENVDPAELLRILNRVVHRNGGNEFLMTALAMVLDANANTVRYANASHNFPFLISSRGVWPKVEVIVCRGGDPLGFRPDASYQNQVRPLGPGDRVVLYTDGVVDAGSSSSRVYGDRRLHAFLQRVVLEQPSRIPALLLADVEEHLAGNEPEDDITIVLAAHVGVSNRGSRYTDTPFDRAGSPTSSPSTSTERPSGGAPAGSLRADRPVGEEGQP